MQAADFRQHAWHLWHTRGRAWSLRATASLPCSCSVTCCSQVQQVTFADAFVQLQRRARDCCGHCCRETRLTPSTAPRLRLFVCMRKFALLYFSGQSMLPSLTHITLAQKSSTRRYISACVDNDQEFASLVAGMWPVVGCGTVVVIVTHMSGAKSLVRVPADNLLRRDDEADLLARVRATGIIDALSAKIDF